MCADGIQQVRQDQALDLLRQARADYPQIHAIFQHTPEDFLALVERRTGLLIQTGHTRYNGRSVPVYEFRHLTFQEYLAGIALVQGHYRGQVKGQTLAEAVAPLAGLVTHQAFGDLGASEAAVVENWREALRLCLAACNDDAVDSVLLAILEPLPGEPGTVRPRAVMAALCLADEPNASDGVAQMVLAALVGQVGEGDGMGDVSSGLDAAVTELGASRWARPVGELLLDQFLRREPQPRTSFGGLYATVQESGAPGEEADFSAWLGDKARVLAEGGESEAAATSLAIMQLAWRGKDCRTPGLADSLIRRLSGSAPMSHEAAWALGWMNDELHGPSAWMPDTGQSEGLVDASARLDCDPETLFLLCRIFET